MQSRMDKYNSTTESTYKSRTKKNQDLYEDVRNSALTNFDVNSNVSVIDTNANSIDVNKLSQILDKKYNEYAPKRRSIEVPAYEEPIIEQPLVDTKEYDINAILEKAKQGKNVDYNKERLKKVREAQYEILNNLDLELKKVEEAKKTTQKKEEEENLMSLINTITQLEIQNRENNKDTSQALELLSDLSDDASEVSEDDKTLPQKEIKEEKEVKEEIEPSVKIEEHDEEEKQETTRDEHVEKTLSKLDINLSSYDEFSDISKQDKSALIIKIVIFIIIIGLVIGAVYILNNILELGLF